MHRTRTAGRRTAWALALWALVSSGADAQAPDLDRILSTTLDANTTASIRGGEATIRWQLQGPELSGEVLLDSDSEPPIVERTHHPEFHGGCTTVSRFEHSRSNRLGGRFAATADPPSRAAAELASDEHGARHLRFAYRQSDGHPARLRIRLHDPEPSDHAIYYLDGRAFDAIRFWARRSGESPPMDVGIADAQGDTAIHVGSLRELAVSPVHGEWTLVSIGLDEMPDLVDRRRLAALDLQPSRPGDGTIEIDNLSLCQATAAPDRPAPADAATAKAGRSLWVWHTSDLMVDPGRLVELIETVKERHIDRVYLQLPSALTQAFEDPGTDETIISTATASITPLRAVVGALTDAGAVVDALDGHASFALPDNHAEVEGAVKSVIRYNESSPPAARFAGAHYDIEPYLLPGFGGPARDAIIAGYLSVLKRIAAISRPAQLRFEVAIPFWFDSIRIHRSSRAVEGSLSYRVLSEAVIDLVDAVAIMDYRTHADGSNGTVALAASELEYASETGKRVRIGLETGFLANEEVLRFEGKGETGLPHRESSRPWIVVGSSSDGTHLYVVPSSRLGELPARLRRDNVGTASIRHWRAAQRVRIDSRRLTFYDVGIERLRSVISESTAEMRGYTAFEGFAIHYDRPYRRLLDQRGIGSNDEPTEPGQDQR